MQPEIVNIEYKDPQETERCFNIWRYLKNYPPVDKSTYEVVDTRTLIKLIRDQFQTQEFELDIYLLYIYRHADWKKMILPSTITEHLFSSIKKSLQQVGGVITFHPSEDHWDLLQISIHSEKSGQYNLNDYVWWLLTNTHVQQAHFILTRVRVKDTVAEYMTITQNSELWRFIERRMQNICHVNAPLIFGKMTPNPPIDLLGFDRVIQWYDTVGYYVADAVAGREMTIICLNSRTPNGYPPVFLRHEPFEHNGEVIRRPISIRTSDQVVECVHKHKVLSFVPCCHRRSENFASEIVIDFDAWFSLPYAQYERSLVSRLSDYCRFLWELGIEYYITFSGRSSFHVYIEVPEWTDCSLFLPKNMRYADFLERRRKDLKLIAAHDQVEIMNLYYSITSPIGPMAPSISRYNLDARVGSVLLDNRTLKNSGYRSVASLHQRTILCCRLWELKDIPHRVKDLKRQSTMKFVIHDDLRCLDRPRITNKQKQQNMRAITDIAWEQRKLLFDFYKLGYSRFMHVKRLRGV